MPPTIIFFKLIFPQGEKWLKPFKETSNERKKKSTLMYLLYSNPKGTIENSSEWSNDSAMLEKLVWGQKSTEISFNKQ